MPGRRPQSIADRFHDKYVITELGCWEWRGSRTPSGYGRLSGIGGRGTPPLYAHRVSYELHQGLIPRGFVVDHLCHNRACVNPRHLQLVTERENVLGGNSPTMLTHWTGICCRGHDLKEPAAVYIRPDNGKRMCRECIRIRQRSVLDKHP